MSAIKLFSIYHSFLLKKWYLIAYILLLIVTLFGVMIAIQQFNQSDEQFTIGIVDKDKSSETKLILNAVGTGKSMGEDLSIKKYNEKKARSLLESKKIDGYFVLENGMTKAFYKNGSLPIEVNTYDSQSVKSIAILQLTHSVYSRLMLSMGGALTYNELYPEASEDELLNMMTDMLFTGLNRNGSIEETSVKVFDTTSYYVISAYFLSIFLFFFSLFSILKMNQENALKERLNMFHFSYEKLTIVRGVVSLFYTCLWTALGFYILVQFVKPSFEMYNLSTLILYLSYYLFSLAMLFIWIDICFRNAFNYYIKMALTIVITVFSGAIVPMIYLKGLLGGIFEYLPFTIVLNQLLELILNNYILDTHPMFYISFLIILLLLITSLLWRYKR